MIYFFKQTKSITMDQQKWKIWLIMSCILILLSFSLLVNPITQTLAIAKLIAALCICNLYACIAKGFENVDDNNEDDNNLASS